MAIWTTKIIRRQLTFSPFSSEDMVSIGNVIIDAVSTRIARAVDVADSPARDLKVAYARRKMRYNRAPVRDWNFRGITMKALKVISASEDRVTVGFVNPRADMIAHVQNLRVRMFGLSPQDSVALHAVVLAILKSNNSRSTRTVTRTRVSAG